MVYFVPNDDRARALDHLAKIVTRTNLVYWHPGRLLLTHESINAAEGITVLVPAMSPFAVTAYREYFPATVIYEGQHRVYAYARLPGDIEALLYVAAWVKRMEGQSAW